MGILLHMPPSQTGRALVRRAHDVPAIARRLRLARIARGLRSARAAEMAGITRNALSNWETGRQRPSLDQVILLLPVLGVTLDYLYLGDDRGLTWEVREAIATAGAAADPADDDGSPEPGATGRNHAA